MCHGYSDWNYRNHQAFEIRSIRVPATIIFFYTLVDLMNELIDHCTFITYLLKAVIMVPFYDYEYKKKMQVLMLIIIGVF